MKYREMNSAALSAAYTAVKAQYEDIKAMGMSLDISRGKPCTEQLNLSDGMLTVLTEGNECKTEKGFDCRNYGLLEGIPEAQELFAELLGIPRENLILGGGSSLTMMYDTVARAMAFATVSARGAARKR